MIPKKEFVCEECKNSFERRLDAAKKSFKKFNGYFCQKCANKLSFQGRTIVRKLSSEEKVKLAAGRKKRFPDLTIKCKYCQCEFSTPYSKRTPIYCSKKCQIASIPRPVSKLKKQSLCCVCHKLFLHYGERIVCSRKCLAEYHSKVRLGENNPNWISHDQCDKSKCLNCGVIFTYKRNGLHKGARRYFCSLKCSLEKGGGVHINNEIKKEYIIYSKEYDIVLDYKSNPYPKEWNEELKNRIKERDGFCCALCSNQNDLEVHHIDYVKSNCQEENLITLCQKCHNITNHNRFFWMQVFTSLKSNSQIVKKGWGFEIHLVNHKDYCFKYLVFFKGKKISFHKHHLKRELWFCQWGNFECRLQRENETDYFILKAGDKIEIEPETEHQLQALTNCIISEVSTTDFPEDSVRIENGDSQ